VGQDGQRHQSRLATFGPGMCFGEIALLSGKPRMANGTANLPGSCWVLTTHLARSQVGLAHREGEEELLHALEQHVLLIAHHLAGQALQLATPLGHQVGQLGHQNGVALQ